MLHDGEWRAAGVQRSEVQAAADVSVVLVTPLVLLDVSGQVRVHHAHIRVVEAETDRHSTLVPLGGRGEGRERKRGRDRARKTV